MQGTFGIPRRSGIEDQLNLQSAGLACVIITKSFNLDVVKNAVRYPACGSGHTKDYL